MGFRMRKSIKVAPGVRLNVSKTGVGGSVGGGGVRYSAHSSGRRTVSASTGVPGVYFQKGVGGGRRGSRGASGRAAAATPAPATPKKPGLFAPKGEKQLYKAVKAQDVQAMKRVGAEHPDFRLPAYSMASLMLATSEGEEARRLAEEAFAIGNPAEDAFVSKYLYTEVTLKIAPGVVAELPLNRDALGLLLAELRQDAGDAEGAIDVVEQLEPTSYAAVSLAELYASIQRWDDVIELTDTMSNEDDLTALLCVYRGVAMRERGHRDASLEAFKEALRSRSRDEEIRKLALSERAKTYDAQGKKGMARKDLERVLAMDSSFEGVLERLEALT